MPLQIMEHYLVLTDDIDRTRRFYIDILGLSDGFRPELGFPGYWLYLGELPVLHIAEWETYTKHAERLGIRVTRPGEGTGCLDHVAFNGHDAEEMVARLDAAGETYERHDVPEIGLIQLFLDDPNGLKLELNFR